MKYIWKHIGTIIDGELFKISEVNIWDYKWNATGEKISVEDPIYGQSHILDVYEIEKGNSKIRFAAGEFSNLVWGIYQES